MIIFFSRFGFLVLVITLVVLVATYYITNAVAGDNQFYTNNDWPKLLATFISGLVVFVVGKLLNKNARRVVVDKETGEEIGITNYHSFFFIRMELWGLIIPVIGALVIIFK